MRSLWEKVRLDEGAHVVLHRAMSAAKAVAFSTLAALLGLLFWLTLAVVEAFD